MTTTSGCHDDRGSACGSARIVAADLRAATAAALGRMCGGGGVLDQHSLARLKSWDFGFALPLLRDVVGAIALSRSWLMMVAEWRSLRGLCQCGG